MSFPDARWLHNGCFSPFLPPPIGSPIMWAAQWKVFRDGSGSGGHEALICLVHMCSSCSYPSSPLFKLCVVFTNRVITEAHHYCMAVFLVRKAGQWGLQQKLWSRERKWLLGTPSWSLTDWLINAVLLVPTWNIQNLNKHTKGEREGAVCGCQQAELLMKEGNHNCNLNRG